VTGQSQALWERPERLRFELEQGRVEPTRGQCVFDDIGAVKAFVGEDHDVARLPARARAVLSHFNERSARYEVIDRRNQARRERQAAVVGARAIGA